MVIRLRLREKKWVWEGYEIGNTESYPYIKNNGKFVILTKLSLITAGEFYDEFQFVFGTQTGQFGLIDVETQEMVIAARFQDTIENVTISFDSRYIVAETYLTKYLMSVETGKLTKFQKSLQRGILK